MIELDIRSRSRTKKSYFVTDSQCCYESDSDFTQKPPTLYDSGSATLVVTPQLNHHLQKLDF